MVTVLPHVSFLQPAINDCIQQYQSAYAHGRQNDEEEYQIKCKLALSQAHIGFSGSALSNW